MTASAVLGALRATCHSGHMWANTVWGFLALAAAVILAALTPIQAEKLRPYLWAIAAISFVASLIVFAWPYLWAVRLTATCASRGTPREKWAGRSRCACCRVLSDGRGDGSRRRAMHDAMCDAGRERTGPGYQRALASQLTRSPLLASAEHAPPVGLPRAGIGSLRPARLAKATCPGYAARAFS